MPVPIADLHCDTAIGFAAGRRLDDPDLQVNLPAMAETGMGLQVFACYVPPAVPEGRRYDFVSRVLDALDRELDAFSGDISVCRTSQDILDTRAAGRFAAVLAVENGDAIENDLANLERLYARGVRLMTLVHSRSNAWVVSSADREPAFDGLSRFGEEVVALMNRIGMIVDVSHAHDAAVRKVLSLSCRPVVASHSCSYTLCPLPRNLKDDLIKGIAAGGGLIGVNIYPGFLDGRYRKESERAGGLFERLGREEEKAGADPAAQFALLRDLADKFSRAMEKFKVPLDRYLEHIYHMINVAGEDHVAFGSDFDGIPDLPAGVTGCRGLRTAQERLSEAEMPRKTIEKVCWTNFLRVFKDVCG
jgi:membrane dipeptidase